MSPIEHAQYIKAPKVVRSKGRARPDEPLLTWCELALPACTGRAEVRHHRFSRGKGGSDESANTMDICDSDHRHVHAHPEESFAHGWLLRAEP